jgi:Flp pilus assembly protein TadG
MQHHHPTRAAGANRSAGATGWRRMAADQHGAAVLELAFLAPVLVLLLFGVIELSRFHYIQGTVQSATAAVLRAATIDRSLSEAGARAVFMSHLIGVDPSLVGSFSLERNNAGPNTLQRVTIRAELTFTPFLPILLQGGVSIESELEGFTIG